MKKIIFSIILITVLIFSFCSCGKNDNNGDTTESTTQIVQNEPANTADTEISTTIPQSEVIAVQPESTIAPTVEQTQAPVETTVSQSSAHIETSQTESTTKVYEKTGEMAFSDSADNKYIKAIIDKYNVKSENLVAIYTVPDNDGNLVLEFDGSADENGKKIRNKDTLVAIYSIDRNLNSKCASEDKSKNEYSYGEMKVIFFSTTSYIMPEFKDKL